MLNPSFSALISGRRITEGIKKLLYVDLSTNLNSDENSDFLICSFSTILRGFTVFKNTYVLRTWGRRPPLADMYHDRQKEWGRSRSLTDKLVPLFFLSANNRALCYESGKQLESVIGMFQIICETACSVSFFLPIPVFLYDLSIYLVSLSGTNVFFISLSTPLYLVSLSGTNVVFISL